MAVLQGGEVRRLVRNNPELVHPPAFRPGRIAVTHTAEFPPDLHPSHPAPTVLQEATAALGGVAGAIRNRLEVIAHPPQIENLEL